MELFFPVSCNHADAVDRTLMAPPESAGTRRLPGPTHAISCPTPPDRPPPVRRYAVVLLPDLLTFESSQGVRIRSNLSVEVPPAHGSPRRFMLAGLNVRRW